MCTKWQFPCPSRRFPAAGAVPGTRRERALGAAACGRRGAPEPRPPLPRSGDPGPPGFWKPAGLHPYRCSLLSGLQQNCPGVASRAVAHSFLSVLLLLPVSWIPFGKAAGVRSLFIPSCLTSVLGCVPGCTMHLRCLVTPVVR